jgi:hypothetical protein
MKDRDVRSGRRTFQLPANLKPAHVREIDVEENEVRGFRAPAQSLGPGGGFQGLVASFLQGTGHRVSESLVVVDDQYPYGRRARTIGAKALPVYGTHDFI